MKFAKQLKIINYSFIFVNSYKKNIIKEKLKIIFLFISIKRNNLLIYEGNEFYVNFCLFKHAVIYCSFGDDNGAFTHANLSLT